MADLKVNKKGKKTANMVQWSVTRGEYYSDCIDHDWRKLSLIARTYIINPKVPKVVWTAAYVMTCGCDV